MRWNCAFILWLFYESVVAANATPWGDGARGSIPSVSWLVHGWDEAECALARASFRAERSGAWNPKNGSARRHPFLTLNSSFLIINERRRWRLSFIYVDSEQKNPVNRDADRQA